MPKALDGVCDCEVSDLLLYRGIRVLSPERETNAFRESERVALPVLGLLEALYNFFVVTSTSSPQSRLNCSGKFTTRPGLASKMACTSARTGQRIIASAAFSIAWFCFSRSPVAFKISS